MVIQSCPLTITPAEMRKLSVTWLHSSSDHMIDGHTDWLAFGAKYSESHWSMLSFHVWSTDAWHSIKSSMMKREEIIENLRWPIQIKSIRWYVGDV